MPAVPQSAILGHEKTVREFGEFAKSGRLGHGYVFFGPSMVGKRTVALGLAHFLEKGSFEQPSGEKVLQDAKVIDLAFMKSLDPDSKDSIGIDAVREIRNFLWQKPNASPRRTLVIDRAELLTREAQNALLKITEEPPASSLIILITSDVESVIPTILSRIPKIYFGVAPGPVIETWLIKEHGLAKTDAKSLAEKSMGKPGLALRLAHDEPFKEQLLAAEKFLKSAPAAGKEFIKKLIEPDDFTLRNFLDAVIITLAWEKPSSRTRALLWHKALALQQNATNFGLSPRLQLENLLR